MPKRAKLKPAPDDESGVYRPSSINLRALDWTLLRWVADARADQTGGRPSVSKVIESLIDANRKALESEARSLTNPFK